MLTTATIYVQDGTSPGTYTGIELERLVWSLRYWGLYHYNRSPWVEHGYAEFAVGDVKLLPAGQLPPRGGWFAELLDTSDQPGAIGYHEDRRFDAGSPGVKKASRRSSRGLGLHPATEELIPVMKVFDRTAKDDGVRTSEVLCHEAGESLVDPWVTDESRIRKYLDPATKQWWICEIGDPVQGRGYDVGAPEGRPCGFPEAVMADIGYPRLWGLDQSRAACSFTEDTTAWSGAPAPNSGLRPFTVAPLGYMSVAPEAEPGNWSQINGSEAAPGGAV